MKQSLFTEISENIKGLDPSKKEDAIKYLQAVSDAVDNSSEESVRSTLKVYIFNSIFKDLINPIQKINDTIQI